MIIEDKLLMLSISKTNLLNIKTYKRFNVKIRLWVLFTFFETTQHNMTMLCTNFVLVKEKVIK